MSFNILDVYQSRDKGFIKRIIPWLTGPADSICKNTPDILIYLIAEKM
jgi:hypothetical protein